MTRPGMFAHRVGNAFLAAAAHADEACSALMAGQRDDAAGEAAEWATQAALMEQAATLAFAVAYDDAIGAQDAA